MMMVIVLLLTLWSTLIEADAKKVCSVKALTNECRFFKDLDLNDQIEFTDGRKVAACFFTTVGKNIDTKIADQKRDILLEISSIINSIPISILSNRFKEEILKNPDIILSIFSE